MIFKANEDGSLTNIFKELKSIQVTFEDLDKSTLRSVIKAFNSTSMSVDDLSTKFGGLDNSVITYLKSTEKGKASMDGMSESINISATSMVSAASKAKLLSIALNTLSGLALKGITGAIDMLIITLDEQKEKLDSAITAYEESRTELGKLNDELQTTTLRIDVLNSRDNLTFTEQDELEELIKTNDELERKIYLLEQANKVDEKEIAAEAQKTYDKYINNRELSAVEQIDFYTNGSLLEGVEWNDFKDDLSWLVAQYRNQQNELTIAQENGWTNIEKQVKSNLELLKGYMSETSLDYQDLYDKINNLDEFVMTENLELAKQDLDGILDIVAEILGYDGQRFKTSFDVIWNSEDFIQYRTELEQLSKDGKLDASTLESNEQYKRLLESTGATAENTAQHINALVAEMDQSSDSEIYENYISPQSLSSTITQLNTYLKPTFDSLKSAYQNIFTDDGFSLDSVDILSTCDSIKAKLDELNKTDGITVDYSSYEDFVRVLSDSESTEKDVEDAFDALAASITNAGLSGAEDFGTMKAALADLGVVNSEMVAFDALTSNAEALKEAGLDLANTDDEVVSSFVNEMISADNCGQALALLQLKKALCNETALNPGSDINSLYRLAKAAGIATENIAMLAGLNDAYEKEAAAGNTPAALAIMHKMEQVKADVEKQFSGLGSVQVEFGSKGGSLSQAAEKAETDWKSLLDRETSLLEKQLDAHLITFREYTDKRREIIEDYYRDGKIRAEEYYGALESMYSDQLSLHDRAVSAVTGSIDAEIDRLKDRKEAVEESYQAKIDAIQSEIDALNKANDARKEQIDLEKAQYEAGRARNQRVNKVFDGGQFVYAADGEAIRDAENDLADREFRLNIALLEGQIDSLKAEMENATMSLDSQITALESYRDKWNEISAIYGEQQDRLIAAEILGADWEAQVLSGRLDTLQSFTEQYIALQQAQADAAVNAARIKAEADAGNTTGGKVGDVPDTAERKVTSTDESSTSDVKSTPALTPKKLPLRSQPVAFESNDQKYMKSSGNNTAVNKVKFHSGLDEGYVGGTPAGPSGNKTLEVLRNAAERLHLSPDEVPAVLKTGELVLTPEQQENILRNARAEFLRSQGVNIEGGGNAIAHIQGSPQNVYNNTFSINCPNVTNNSGAEYILKSLQRLPLDTIQYTHRRQK